MTEALGETVKDTDGELETDDDGEIVDDLQPDTLGDVDGDSVVVARLVAVREPDGVTDLDRDEHAVDVPENVAGRGVDEGVEDDTRENETATDRDEHGEAVLLKRTEGEGDDLLLLVDVVLKLPEGVEAPVTAGDADAEELSEYDAVDDIVELGTCVSDDAADNAAVCVDTGDRATVDDEVLVCDPVIEQVLDDEANGDLLSTRVLVAVADALAVADGDPVDVSEDELVDEPVAVFVGTAVDVAELVAEPVAPAVTVAVAVAEVVAVTVELAVAVDEADAMLDDELLPVDVAVAVRLCDAVAVAEFVAETVTVAVAVAETVAVAVAVAETVADVVAVAVAVKGAVAVADAEFVADAVAVTDTAAVVDAVAVADTVAVAVAVADTAVVVDAVAVADTVAVAVAVADTDAVPVADAEFVAVAVAVAETAAVVDAVAVADKDAVAVADAEFVAVDDAVAEPVAVIDAVDVADTIAVAVAVADTVAVAVAVAEELDDSIEEAVAELDALLDAVAVQEMSIQIPPLHKLDAHSESKEHAALRSYNKRRDSAICAPTRGCEAISPLTRPNETPWATQLVASKKRSARDIRNRRAR